MDVGSYDVNGTYRPLLTNESWTHEGADLQAGPNVTHVLTDPYHWVLSDDSFDVVTSGQTFEHIPFFWLTWKEMVRVLKRSGLIFLIMPSSGVERLNPVDCSRLYRDGFRALGDIEHLEILEMETHWTSALGDTVGVFRKPTTWQSRQNDDGVRLAPGAIKLTPSSQVREATYAARYGMSVADWMIHHQENIVFDHVHWMGVKALKNPLDCWIYQEILWQVRPDVVVEIGSFHGGSTLYFCHLLDLLGHGIVVSVEENRAYFAAKHPRLVEITGNSGEQPVKDQVAALCTGKKTLIVQDADHSKDAVLRDLHLYADLA